MTTVLRDTDAIGSDLLAWTMQHNKKEIILPGENYNQPNRVTMATTDRKIPVGRIFGYLRIEKSTFHPIIR